MRNKYAEVDTELILYLELSRPNNWRWRASCDSWCFGLIGQYVFCYEASVFILFIYFYVLIAYKKRIEQIAQHDSIN